MTHTLKKCFGTSDSEAFFISLNINTIQTRTSSLQVLIIKKRPKNLASPEIMSNFAPSKETRTPQTRVLRQNKLPCGVMVALRILVPSVRVRVLPRQQIETLSADFESELTVSTLFLSYMLMETKDQEKPKADFRRKPDWLKIKLPRGFKTSQVVRLLNEKHLHTICSAGATELPLS